MNLRETAFAFCPQQKIFFPEQLPRFQDNSKLCPWSNSIYLSIFNSSHTQLGRAQLKLKHRVLLKQKCCGFIYCLCSINVRSYTLHHLFPYHFAWGTKSGSLAVFQLFSCWSEFLLSLKSFLWYVCGVFFPTSLLSSSVIVVFHLRGSFFFVEFKWYLRKRANLADAYCN